MKKILACFIVLAGCSTTYIPVERQIPLELLDCHTQRPSISTEVTSSNISRLLLEYDAALEHCINNEGELRELFGIG